MRQPDGTIDELRRPPKSIGYWHDLYTPPPGLSPELQLEELFFKKLDDRTSTVFTKLENGQALSGEESGTLAIFLLSLMHRSPAAFEALQKVSSGMLRGIWEDLRPRYPELRGSSDPLTVEEYETSEGPDADLRAFYRNLPGFIVNENVVRFISALHWKILHRPDHLPLLLISDDPLIRTNGLKKDDGHLAFALSPDRLVLAAHKKEFADFVINSPPKEIFTNANIQSVESARHFVASPDTAQARFIRNRFGRNLRPTLGEQMLKNMIKM